MLALVALASLSQETWPGWGAGDKALPGELAVVTVKNIPASGGWDGEEQQAGRVCSGISENVSIMEEIKHLPLLTAVTPWTTV